MGFKYLIVAIAGALAINAQAADTNWGTHGELEVGVNLVSPGAFSDTFNFTLTQESNLMSTAVSNNLGSVLQLDNGTVRLYREAGVEDVLLGSYSFDGTTGSTSHTFAIGGAGSYYYNVLGEASGSSGGFYSLTSTAGAVPEPETLALTLAGLVAAGGMYRRRIRAS